LTNGLLASKLLMTKITEVKKVSFFGFKKRASCDFLIVGLGNPGEKYSGTRHNAGFMVLDYISGRAEIPVKKLKHMAMTGKGNIAGKSVLLMKPQTYMNNSGESVADAAAYYKIPPENIIIIFDDISLELGQMRIRRKGSDGGHKGIKSIIEHIGQDFPRLKIGIGNKPHPDYNLADYVLSKLKAEDYARISAGFDKVFGALELIISGETDKAMNIYN